MKSYFDFTTERLLEEIDYTSKSFHKSIRQILRNYGTIPISKDNATETIQKIVGSEVKYSSDPEHTTKFPHPILTDTQKMMDSDFNLMKPSNKVRMYDYLNSLITSKTIRGDSFEGLIAGLYDGKTAQHIEKNASSRWDVKVPHNERNPKDFFISVKFLDSKDERPVLGNIKSFITKKMSEKGSELNEILKSMSKQEQYDLLNKAFKNVTHFLFGYPEEGLNIRCQMFTRESVIKRYILDSDVRYAPKQKGSFQVRININSLAPVDTDQSWLLIAPVISEQDLEYLEMGNVRSAKRLFGTDAYRMRGSILNSILKYGQFTKLNDKDVFVFDYRAYKQERGH